MGCGKDSQVALGVRRHVTRRLLGACAASALAAAFGNARLAGAAGYTWNGSGGNANWSTGANWIGGSAPTSNDSATLTFAGSNNLGTVGTPLNQNIDSSEMRLQSLTFASGAGAFFLGGSPLRSSSSTSNLTITQSATNNQSIANAIMLHGDDSLTLTGSTSGVVTLSGVISETDSESPGSLLKSGTSTYVLSASNSFTSSTTISGGTLQVAVIANGGSDSGIGASSNAAGNLVLNGGVLRYVGSAAASTNRNFTLGTSGGGFDSSSASSSNTLSISGSMTASGSSGSQTFTLGGSNTGNNTLSGVIRNGSSSNVTALNKNGVGKWILTATNTYTGSTTINAGTLRITAPGALGTGGVTVNAAVLEIGGVSVTANDLTLNNGATLLGTGAASYSKSGNPVIASGASVTLSTSANGDVLTIGSGYANAGGSTATPTVNISNGGTGTVALSSGASAFRGKWNIQSGTLQSSANNNTFGIGNTSGSMTGSTVTLAGGNLEVRGGASNITYNAGTAGAEVPMSFSANGTVAAGRSSSGAGITHTFGALTLGSNSDVTATFTHTGNVTSGTSAFTFGAVTLNGNATVAVNKPNGSVTSQVTFGAVGETGGSRSLTKSGSGQLVLTGTSTYSGTTSVTGGTALVNGTLDSSGGAMTVSGSGVLGGSGTINRTVTVNSGGTVSAGSSTADAILTINKSFTLNSGATFQVDVSGQTAGTNYDQVVVGGGATSIISLGGATLQLVSIGNFFSTTPPKYQGGLSFTIVKNSANQTVSGTFAGLAEGAAFDAIGTRWTISYHASGGGGNNDVVISTVPEPTGLVSVLTVAGCALARRRRRRA